MLDDETIELYEFQYPTLGSFLWKRRFCRQETPILHVSVSYPRIVPMEAPDGGSPPKPHRPVSVSYPRIVPMEANSLSLNTPPLASFRAEIMHICPTGLPAAPMHRDSAPPPPRAPANSILIRKRLHLRWPLGKKRRGSIPCQVPTSDVVAETAELADGALEPRVGFGRLGHLFPHGDLGHLCHRLLHLLAQRRRDLDLNGAPRWDQV